MIVESSFLKLQEFQKNEHILCQAEPLINLLRIRVTGTNSSSIPTLAVDEKNKAKFLTEVPDNMLKNSKYTLNI